jgi:L-asparaginase II
LRALATGFARFGTGVGLAADHAAAAGRLRSAGAAHPWYVAGTGRFCTDVMTVTGPRAFVKVGAEGAYTAALPDVGFGVALKVEDGAFRAAEVALAAVLQRLLPDLDLERFVRPPVTTWRGVVVGELRPAPGVASGPV